MDLIHHVQRGNHRTDAARGEPQRYHDAKGELAAVGVGSHLVGDLVQQLERRRGKQVAEVRHQAVLQLGAMGGKQAEQGQHEQDQREQGKQEIKSQFGSGSREIGA